MWTSLGVRGQLGHGRRGGTSKPCANENVKDGSGCLRVGGVVVSGRHAQEVEGTGCITVGVVRGRVGGRVGGRRTQAAVAALVL